MRVSKYGIFLIVYNGSKKYNWQNIHTNKSMSFSELVNSLKVGINEIKSKYENIDNIEIVGIDFNIR